MGKWIWPWRRKTKLELIRTLRVALKSNQVAIIRNYKNLIPCYDCRKNYPWHCITFDHRDRGTKVGDIMHMAGSVSLEALIKEIHKCDLVCRNCHALREFKRDNEPATPAYIARKLKNGMKLG